MFTVPLLSHHLVKRCPGVIVQRASLKPSRKSPSHLPAMRKRTHLQVNFIAPPHVMSLKKKIKNLQWNFAYIVWLLCLQASACQRVWIPLSWLLFLRTFVERCCKISLASDHLPVLLLPPPYLPLLDQCWEDQGSQRSALSSWQHCHLPSRRRWEAQWNYKVVLNKILNT